jgi:hypothetical protein
MIRTLPHNLGIFTNLNGTWGHPGALSSMVLRAHQHVSHLNSSNHINNIPKYA